MPIVLILLLFSGIALILLVPAVKGMLSSPVVVPSDDVREAHQLARDRKPTA